MLNRCAVVLLVLAFTLTGAGLWAEKTTIIDVKTSKLAALPEVEQVRAKIGSGPDEFATSGPNGPMSFVISKAGEFYILDQENSRIQVFKNNKWIKTIPINIPRFYAHDIELLPDNRIALMDNVVGKKICLIDESGKKLNEFKLACAGVPDPVSVRGMYIVNMGGSFDGIWVQYKADSSTRIAFLTGEPDPDRIGMVYRLTQRDDQSFMVETVGEATAVVTASAYVPHVGRVHEYSLLFDTRLWNLLGFDEDGEGNIYFLTMHWEEHPGHKITDERNIVTVMTRDGSVEKQFLIHFPASPIPYRSLRISPAGKVYSMAIDEKGLCIRMYNPWK